MLFDDPRFWAKVAIGDGCWEWTGARNRLGYGYLNRRPVRYLAHRYAYLNMVGPIPEGLPLDHLCRNPPCVRPDHLEVVTYQENSLRGMHGHMITHCPAGHPYDEANTYWQNGGKHRACRICHATRVREAKRGRMRASLTPAVIVIPPRPSRAKAR